MTDDTDDIDIDDKDDSLLDNEGGGEASVDVLGMAGIKLLGRVPNEMGCRTVLLDTTGGKMSVTVWPIRRAEKGTLLIWMAPQRKGVERALGLAIHAQAPDCKHTGNEQQHNDDVSM